MPYIVDNIKNANLGWLYYKKYFDGNNEARDLKRDENNHGRDTLANRNYTITQRLQSNSNTLSDVGATQKFPLYTTYPGLLLGSGYTHEYGDGTDKNDAFKIGFFFDHISGLPCIPGHGVKGALRAAFPNHKYEKYCKEKSEFIVSLISEPELKFQKYLNDNNITGVSFDAINFATLLGEIMFEGKKPIYAKDGKFKDFVQMPLSDKDIYHDAYIVSGGNGQLFLANDYITHHENPLKDPNPVQFLKVLSNVCFQFQFDLKNNLIAAEEKEILIKTIITTLGVGAKTNVGYGQFSQNKILNSTNIANSQNTIVNSSTLAKKNKTDNQSKNFELAKGESFHKNQEVSAELIEEGELLVFKSTKGSRFSKKRDAVLLKFKEKAGKENKQYKDLQISVKYKIIFNDDVNLSTNTANFTVLPYFI